MPVARRLAAFCAALLVMLALGAGAAVGEQAAGTAVTAQIFEDFTIDGAIDGHYQPADLDRALDLARDNGPSFSAFASAVSDKYDRDILGLDTSGPAAGDENSLLPVPTAPGERDQPPWPFLALSALAAALVLTGAGSSIYRRARR
jgi:hypothetical protein